MVLDAERRRSFWSPEEWKPGRFAIPASAALTLAGVGAALFIVYGRATISGEAAGTALFFVALCVSLAIAVLVTCLWHRALAGRLDILQQALDASPDAQLILAPEGRLVYASAAFLNLFPRPGEPPLQRIERAVAADAQSQGDFRRLLSQAAAGSRAMAAVFLGDPEGAAAGWFTISVNPIAGCPGYRLWNLEDITARHQMEAVIRDERNKLGDFLASAPVGFYSVDHEGRFLFVNETLAGWLGVNGGEVVASGARLQDFLSSPPSAGAPAYAPFQEEEGGGMAEVVLRGRQGRLLPVAIRQSVVGEGADLRTRSVVRDLSPEREWEAALRLSRERFQRFFDHAPVGIALIDSEGRLEEANRAMGQLLGALPKALFGQKLIDFLQEEDRRDFALKLKAVAGRGQPEPFEVRFKGSREKTAVATLSGLDGAEGGEGGLMLHLIDVTDQKHLEVQVAQSQKMQAVGQLAGGVAHDFNNLLTAMIGFCDFLLQRFRPGDPSFSDIMQIRQNANRAANLVRQLLAFSRQQTLQPRVLDITDVLVELSHLLRRLIGEKIELKVVLGRDLGLVKVDQGQIEQVIINLAVNARDAMPQGGRLIIRTANFASPQPVRRGLEVMPAGEYVLIEVADAGVGIAREDLERIFEPFFSTQEVGSGTGLGLSTVYGIVKQTGGFIFVESAPGRGTQFQIYLPRYEAREGELGERAEGAETQAARDLTGIGTILLVEDDDPVRIFSARALRNKGYKVVEARSGEGALEVMGQMTEPIDLIVTDVVMPRMDGPELVRKVREQHPEMKVVFISGYAEDSFRQRLGSDGDTHLLPKPFSLKQLAGKVKEVLSGENA